MCFQFLGEEESTFWAVDVEVVFYDSIDLLRSSVMMIPPKMLIQVLDTRVYMFGVFWADWAWGRMFVGLVTEGLSSNINIGSGYLRRDRPWWGALHFRNGSPTGGFIMTLM